MEDTNPNELMQQIDRALETAPVMVVPDDFAARVMARIPAHPQRRIVMPALPSRARFGRMAIIVAMLLLVAGTIIVAPHTRGSSLWLMLQAVLLAQLGTLVLLFGRSILRTR